MQSIILAAGLGKRISSSHDSPKILLKFKQKTLLERHIVNLRNVGVEKIILCLGYKHEMVCEEVKRLGLCDVEIILNKDFHLGSMISLLKTKEATKRNQDTLLLDADVLYHSDIIRRLAKTKYDNCLLIDRNFDDDVEPVKVCVKNKKIVEFRKQVSPQIEYDTIGESVGFFRFSEDGLESIFKRCEKFLTSGRVEEPHEEVIRECIIDNKLHMSFEDITGLPWLEIDFPEDIMRASKDILPHIPFEEFTR